MIDDPVLWLWMVAAFVALVWRLLLLGGEVIDLERLLAHRRNGLTRIESVEHVRTQAQWAFVAVVLLVVGLLAMLDVVGRGELSRWLLLSTTVVMAVAPIWEWWDRRRKIRLTIAEDLADEDDRTADLRADLESYRQMAETAIATLEAAANALLAEQGKPPITALVEVVPEHSSPVTPQQRETADVATQRARLVAASLSLGQPPRTEPGADDAPESEP